MYELNRTVRAVIATVVAVLCKMDSKYNKFVRKDGKIVVRLKKALYGCIQSAVLWYKELGSTIMSLGFISNPYDICSYTRNRNESVDTILIYVDDLFMTSDSNYVLTTIADALKLKYGAVTSHTGLQHDFLGIHSISGEVSLSMKGYLKDIMRKYKVTRKSKTPATDKLFTTDINSPLLSNVKREEFHSAVMALHYLAKRIKPDILTAISFCATRVCIHLWKIN